MCGLIFLKLSCIRMETCDQFSPVECEQKQQYHFQVRANDNPGLPKFQAQIFNFLPIWLPTFLNLQLQICFDWSIRPYQGLKYFADYYSFCEQNLEFWNWCSVFHGSTLTTGLRVIGSILIKRNHTYFLPVPTMSIKFRIFLYYLFVWLLLSSFRFHRFRINEFKLKASDAKDWDWFLLWSKFTVLYRHNSYRFEPIIHLNNVEVSQVLLSTKILTFVF